MIYLDWMDMLRGQLGELPSKVEDWNNERHEEIEAKVQDWNHIWKWYEFYLNRDSLKCSN